MEITPLKNPVCARIRVPGSKSYTNRALIMAALTKGAVSLKDPLYSEDTEAMLNCLQALGLEIKVEPGQIIVLNDISCIEDKNYQLFAHDSGTTVRFMLALLCIVPGVKTIQGSKRLNERPVGDLVDALRQLGAELEYCAKEGQLPIRILSSSLTGGAVQLKSHMSSQFCSALLLISPHLSEGLTIDIKGPIISKPYIEMTVTCMQEWGVKVRTPESGKYIISNHQAYIKKEYLIEGDFSSAGYFFAIAALTKSTIIVENLNPATVQADRKLLDILSKMGNIVSMHANSVLVEGKHIAALEVDMEDCPDQVMTIAVLAAFANGTTKISGVRSLRVKETERVLAIKAELNKMGIRADDTHDTLTIYGGSPQGAEIDTYNDHRMAMAFAVAGMHVPGQIIRHPHVVKKTFPSFWETLRSLA